jgi:hypothetical protein
MGNAIDDPVRLLDLPILFWRGHSAVAFVPANIFNAALPSSKYFEHKKAARHAGRLQKLQISAGRAD